MSKTAVIFFIVMLVITSCFIAGCSSLPFTDNGTPAPTETPKKLNAGLAEQKKPDTAQRYSFENPVAKILTTDLFDEQNTVPANESGGNIAQGDTPFERHIKYIHGADLDEKGDARSWAFIVEHGDKYSIVSYTDKVVAISNVPGSIAGTEILTDQILSPRELFEKNRAVISGTAGSRDLSLDGGNYTITISGQGTPRILIFDAKTGALILTND
ncbi:MAG: hypothetical protein LUO98_01770 [Methanoregula sp.]|nr:hypothetical protein [Methanoregula sp.]